MLVLTRKERESIVITGNAKITILKVGPGNMAKIGIDAPKSVKIWRTELLTHVETEDKDDI